MTWPSFSDDSNTSEIRLVKFIGILEVVVRDTVLKFSTFLI
jgi:hypothetical protein